LRVRVTALKRVDLPTLGRPTIPAWSIGVVRIAGERAHANGFCRSDLAGAAI